MGFFSSIIKGIGKLFNAILDPLLGWLTPSPPDKQGLKIDRQGSDQAIPVLYGTQKLGAIKVHKYVTDQAGGAKNEFLHLICVFAEGEVDAIEEIYFNGISENDSQWNKKGGGKWYRIVRYTGTAGQAADSAAVAEIPNWTINHKLSGLCYAYIRLELDKDQTVWRGEPQITARIRGRKLFDPRTNTTSYSNNPALVLRDYLTNSIYGKGLGVARLDSASFIAIANFCDTAVTNEVTRTVCEGEYDLEDQFVYSCTTETVTESKPIFTCNIFLDTSKNIFENIKEILGTFRGILPLSAGSIKLNVERDGSPVFNFNDTNLTGSIDVDSGSINDRYNRVEVRFPNQAKDFENDSVFYPSDDNTLSAEWLAEDNGVRLEQSFEFTGITKKDEALQMAEIIAKKSRYTKSVGLESQPIGIIVEAGDIVSLTNAMHGWVEKPFRVIEKTINDDDTIKFALTEHENAVYPWSGATFSDLSGGTFLGDPTKLPSPTNAQLQPDLSLVETGVLTWNFESNAFIRRFEIELIKDSVIVLTLEAIGQSVTVPLLDSGNYVANIYAVSSTGFRSPELAFSFTLAAPTAPTSISLTSSDWEIDAAPQLANIGLGTTFEFDVVEGDGSGYTPTAKARGASYAATGLPPSTLHTIFARSINAFGVSAWVSNSATTTITGVQTQPFLDGIELNISVLDSILGGVDAIIEDVAQDIQEVYQRSSVEDKVRQVEINNLAQIELLVDEYLNELEGETLPELNARLLVAEGEINTLETVTIPAVNLRLDDAESEITVINSTTIPQLQSDLDIAEGQIAGIQGEIFNVSVSVPQTIDDVLETVAQDISEVYDRTDAVNNETAARKAAILQVDSDLTQLNTVTLPALESSLAQANLDIAALDGLFPITETSISSNAISSPKIQANAITADKIVAGAITTDKMTANTINGDRIAANTLAANKIVANSITADQIAARTITATRIGVGQITADEIAALTITAAKMAALSITTDKLAAFAVTADKVQANAITAVKIAANAVEADKILANAVTSAKIVANAISADKIATNAVTADKIAANSVTADKIVSGSVTADKIAANSVDASKIVAGSITATQIAASTISGDKIAANTISGDKIVANTIVGNLIASRTIVGTSMIAGTLTASEIATRTIQAVNIATDSITSTEIKAGTITAANIAALTITGDKIAANTIAAAKIQAGAITADKLSADAIDGKTITGVLVSGSTVRGGSIETIGGTYMIVTRATPFGADNLINWYGPIAGNLSGGTPIYANLTRANAIRWIDAAGEYGRDIISRRQATATASATVTHPSQNNPIIIRGRSAIDINYNEELTYQPPSTAVVTVAYRITKQSGTVAVSRTLSQNVIIQSEPLGDGTYIVDVELYIPVELEFEETIGNASRNYVFEITSITNTASLSLSPVYATSIITTEIRQ